MAGFSFESLKDRLMGKSAPRDEDDTSARDVQSDGYDDGGAYDDQGYDQNYDDQGYDDQGYDQNYDDQGYDDQGYDDQNYDDQGYDDQGYDDQNYDDQGYDDQGYDDQGYDDQNYDDQGYDDQSYGDQGYDDSVYGAEDENPESLGYNPDVFKKLDNENAQDEGAYDDGAYDDDGDQPYDEGDEGYYEDEGSFENENASGLLGYVLSNDWVMYASLVVLPPLGIWLLWRRNKYDITVRAGLTAASVIWMVILLILLFFRSGSKQDNTSVPNSFMSQMPTVTATATATATPAPTTEPSTTPRVSNGSDGTGTTGDSSVTYVWGTNSGKYYHTLENCGGLTNASKMTLETATSRGLLPCPDCAGGTSTTTSNGSTTTSGTTLYATTNGKWYHKDSHCQGMTNAQVVTESNAIKAGKTACPVCIGYYGTPGGKWYHCISNCQGMTSAITKTKAAWEADGKTACPKCIGGTGTSTGGSTTTPTQTMVYATAKGTYYHTKSDCSGMKGASLGTIARAVTMGKKACPTCVKPATIKVFATKGGKYYHTKANCSGMKNAVYVTAETAIQYKKTACPTCAKMFQTTTASNTGTNTGTNTTNGTVKINTAANPNHVPTVNTTETATYVYATKNGKYFHTNKTCSGMANATRGTFTAAVRAGKAPCPTCITPAKLTVYATYGGKYYHVNATCSGMTNAFAVKASTAIAYNKTACPTCAKVLNTLVKKTTNTNNGTNGTNGNNGTNGTNTANNNKATASTNVYIKLGAGADNYYHVAAKCAATGMTGGQNVTLEYALSHKYTACPSCKPPSKIQS